MVRGRAQEASDWRCPQFRGSPHVDEHDTTHQHVIALGEFEGGLLCAEADPDGRQTVAVDVHAKVCRAPQLALVAVASPPCHGS